jgi:LysM repeat protein
MNRPDLQSSRMRLITILLATGAALLFGLWGTLAAQSPCGPTAVAGETDTLAEIALRCGVSVEAVVAANPGLATDDHIQPGQVVQIPGAVAPATPGVLITPGALPTSVPLGAGVPTPIAVGVPVAESALEAGNAPAQTSFVYVVQPGDWLSKLAIRYTTTVEAIVAVNPAITNPDRIEVGQEIVIPVGSASAKGADGSTGAAQPLTPVAMLEQSASGPVITLAGAQPGSRIELTAAGLSPNTEVTIRTAQDAAGASVFAQTARADALGTLVVVVDIPLGSAPVPVQTATATPAPIVATPGAIAGTPLVQIVPVSGPPGSRIEVLGGGFAAGTEVQLSLRPATGLETPIGAAVVTAQGTFSQTAFIPGDAPLESRWVASAIDLTSGFRALSNEFVVAPAPVATVAPLAPPTGTVSTPPLGTRALVFLVVPSEPVQTEAGFTCADTFAPGEVPLDPPQALPRAALEYLVNLREQNPGGTTLLNALYQSTLTVEDVQIVGDEARVALAGQIVATGPCDAARIRQQLELTAKQPEGVTRAAIFVNGVPLADALP